MVCDENKQIFYRQIILLEEAQMARVGAALVHLQSAWQMKRKKRA